MGDVNRTIKEAIAELKADHERYVSPPVKTQNPPNPKKIFGDRKPRLSLVPLSGQLAQFEAQWDGCLKYGEVNWRHDPVEAMTYVDAAMRHLQLYSHGEELARDTTVQNLGAVMACCAILIDAKVHGTLLDNRSISPVECDLLHQAEAMVAKLRDMQVVREEIKAKKVFPAEVKDDRPKLFPAMESIQGGQIIPADAAEKARQYPWPSMPEGVLKEVTSTLTYKAPWLAGGLIVAAPNPDREDAE